MRRTRPQHLHVSPTLHRASHIGTIITAVICVLVVFIAGTLAYGWHTGALDAVLGHHKSTTSSAADTPGDAGKSLQRSASPAPAQKDSPKTQAERLVSAMSLDEQVGQLVMVPLFAGTDPSALSTAIQDYHAGSALMIGNWTTGTEGVKAATDQLQQYAPANNQLIIATDQEGGQVQHLTGTGFDTMPSATEQGTMSSDQLRAAAKGWGSQLSAAGVNVDLAPVLDTVTINRAANAPIGALDRDFGLDAAGNASHGTAFIQGLRDAKVESTIKHYPGLGSVTGNTDFTTTGIVDTATTLDGDEIRAFDTTIQQASPAMVMMALATYQAIDPDNPAVFSSTIITQHLRTDLGYDGVITSDSLSAEALSGYDTTQLGVKMVEAGGDLACIGQTDYVEPIIRGLRTRAAEDQDFAKKVTASAVRVMTLKIEMGLVR
ncbi:glycoside hydrolase family 3 protein [Bifidobacterium olomucense]|uniref:beta-N-acetylhexosaminidase n=1 Tax=Bifidobacterium olomucense TaxID=2675324 RepID=A0A7Y0EXL1_9BIFI|nr:glycoside hydrolase family 3 protein [Bifidobacterium sp. DSM 109959]NMM98277.1 beta-glucosidase [Bifidobacterium sp. DSM 109959]